MSTSMTIEADGSRTTHGRLPETVYLFNTEPVRYGPRKGQPIGVVPVDSTKVYESCMRETWSVKNARTGMTSVEKVFREATEDEIREYLARSEKEVEARNREVQQHEQRNNKVVVLHSDAGEESSKKKGK